MVVPRSRKGRVGSAVRGSVVAIAKIVALLAVCYFWKSDPNPDSKYYLGAIVALAVPIPRKKDK